MPILKLTPKDRTMTRREWKEAYRWLRIASHLVEAELQERFDNLVIYGTTHPEMYNVPE